MEDAFEVLLGLADVLVDDRRQVHPEQVDAELVGVHVLGAAGVWVSVLEVALAAASPVPNRQQASGILAQA